MARQAFTYDRSQSRSRRRLLIFTVFIVLLILFDIVSGGTLRSFARTATGKLWSASASIRSGLFGSGYFVSHAALSRENAALREALAQTREDSASYAALRAENEDLRAMTHVAASQVGITAPVVSSIFSSPYGTFLIGAGKDTAAAGDIALTSDGFAVGIIREADAKTSIATEIFAPGREVNIMIGKSAAQAVGRGGGNARATLPRDVMVAVGDVVISPELGQRHVGIVGKIESSPALSEQTIYISLPVDLSALKFVYLVR